MVDEKMQAADDITNVHAVHLRAIERPAVPFKHISTKRDVYFKRRISSGLYMTGLCRYPIY
jgi:hypothetical protein